MSLPETYWRQQAAGWELQELRTDYLYPFDYDTDTGLRMAGQIAGVPLAYMSIKDLRRVRHWEERRTGLRVGDRDQSEAYQALVDALTRFVEED